MVYVVGVGVTCDRFWKQCFLQPRVPAVASLAVSVAVTVHILFARFSCDGICFSLLCVDFQNVHLLQLIIYFSNVSFVGFSKKL